MKKTLSILDDGTCYAALKGEDNEVKLVVECHGLSRPKYSHTPNKPMTSSIDKVSPLSSSRQTHNDFFLVEYFHIQLNYVFIMGVEKPMLDDKF